MRKLVKIITVLVALIALTNYVGCGEKKTRSTVNNVNQINPDCTPQQVGQAYVCVDGANQVVSDPFANSPKIYSASVQPDNTGFRDFIKEALGVCDRQAGQLLGFDAGSHDCNSYLGGETYFTIYSPSENASTATVTVASYYQQNPGINFNVSFGLTLAPWAYQNPMGLPNLSVAPVNDSQGFEIYGPATNPALQAYSLAWAKRLRIRVDSGKISDSILRADIYYEDQLIAEGVVFQLQSLGY